MIESLGNNRFDYLELAYLLPVSVLSNYLRLFESEKPRYAI